MHKVIFEYKFKRSEGENLMVNLSANFFQEEGALSAKRLRQGHALLEEQQERQNSWNREQEGSGRRHYGRDG